MFVCVSILRMSRSFVLAEFKLTCALAKVLAKTSSQHGGRLRTLFAVAHAIGGEPSLVTTGWCIRDAGGQ